MSKTIDFLETALETQETTATATRSCQGRTAMSERTRFCRCFRYLRMSFPGATIFFFPASKSPRKSSSYSIDAGCFTPLPSHTNSTGCGLFE